MSVSKVFAHIITSIKARPIVISSPGPKGHVNFCHHFASIVVDVRVCKLFIFSSSSLKPLNRFGPNLAEMFIGRFSTRFVILVQIGNPTWLPGPIMCSDWLKLWKSSCQKQLSRWNCSIIEMMTGWSSQVFYFCADRISKMVAMTWLSLTLDPMEKMFKKKFKHGMNGP